MVCECLQLCPVKCWQSHILSVSASQVGRQVGNIVNELSSTFFLVQLSRRGHHENKASSGAFCRSDTCPRVLSEVHAPRHVTF